VEELRWDPDYEAHVTRVREDGWTISREEIEEFFGSARFTQRERWYTSRDGTQVWQRLLVGRTWRGELVSVPRDFGADPLTGARALWPRTAWRSTETEIGWYVEDEVDERTGWTGDFGG
jgi:hypothetical protein